MNKDRFFKIIGGGMMVLSLSLYLILKTTEIETVVLGVSLGVGLALAIDGLNGLKFWHSNK